MRSQSDRLEEFRPELTAHCRRVLGCASEAEDAVQDTMVRAWQGLDRFEGRAALRSWLYRIATNVCHTMRGTPQRRVAPAPHGPEVVDATDPADTIVAHESVRRAFVAAFRVLPPRQRAVLILRDVLAWSARETADLLGTSVPSVNSALQRARATLSTVDADAAAGADPPDPDLLDRHVAAFRAYDLDGLTALLSRRSTVPTG
jgi:RNA polymerase sigma-70 factor, ECF subfamily